MGDFVSSFEMLLQHTRGRLASPVSRHSHDDGGYRWWVSIVRSRRNNINPEQRSWNEWQPIILLIKNRCRYPQACAKGTSAVRTWSSLDSEPEQA